MKNRLPDVNDLVYECDKYGRKSRYMFYGHVSSKLHNDWCDGKVKRIKWKRAW